MAIVRPRPSRLFLVSKRATKTAKDIASTAKFEIEAHDQSIRNFETKVWLFQTILFEARRRACVDNYCASFKVCLSARQPALHILLMPIHFNNSYCLVISTTEHHAYSRISFVIHFIHRLFARAKLVLLFGTLLLLFLPQSTSYNFFTTGPFSSVQTDH